MSDGLPVHKFRLYSLQVHLFLLPVVLVWPVIAPGPHVSDRLSSTSAFPTPSDRAVFALRTKVSRCTNIHPLAGDHLIHFVDAEYGATTSYLAVLTSPKGAECRRGNRFDCLLISSTKAPALYAYMKSLYTRLCI